MRLITILIFLFSTTFGQIDTRRKLVTTFKKSLCACFESSKKENPNDSFSKILNSCGIEFLLKDHVNDLQSLVEEMPDSLTDFQKGRVLGLEIMKESAPAIIRDCSSLSNELVKFKAAQMSWLKISKENVKEKVTSSESRINEVTDITKQASLYWLFGIMYEVDENHDDAQKAYSKSLEIFPSLIAILLQAQLAETKIIR